MSFYDSINPFFEPFIVKTSYASVHFFVRIILFVEVRLCDSPPIISHIDLRISFLDSTFPFFGSFVLFVPFGLGPFFDGGRVPHTWCSLEIFHQYHRFRLDHPKFRPDTLMEGVTETPSQTEERM